MPRSTFTPTTLVNGETVQISADPTPSVGHILFAGRLVRNAYYQYPAIPEWDDSEPEVRERMPLDPNITISFTPRGNRALPTRGRTVFDFLRAHGDGRYRANTLNLMLDRAEQRTLPAVITATKQADYDPLTETKFGGLLGVCAVLPDRRTLIAVHSDHRRQGIGSALYHRLIRELPMTTLDGSMPILWVGRENIVGQQFCLSLPLYPMLTQNTSIGFTSPDAQDL